MKRPEDALARWREHRAIYEPLGARPVLFVMAEKSAHADRIGQWLVENEETGLSEDGVLVIHTNTKGEVTQADLEKARAAVRDIDSPESKIQVVVSVLMLQPRAEAGLETQEEGTLRDF